MYAYYDLVRPREVGDVMAPLLRIVPSTNKTQDVLHHIFEKPHYIELNRINFNTLEIFLTNHNGQQFSFSRGNSIVTLYFLPQTSRQLLNVGYFTNQTMKPTNTITALRWGTDFQSL